LITHKHNQVVAFKNQKLKLKNKLEPQTGNDAIKIKPKFQLFECGHSKRVCVCVCGLTGQTFSLRFQVKIHWTPPSVQESQPVEKGKIY
jgi:hypothetical protein